MESLGRKTAMLVACFFYGLGTILCATAGGMYTLIAARAVAGVSPLLPPLDYVKFSSVGISKLTGVLAWWWGFVDCFVGDRH